MKTWLHRISHYAKISYPLLERGYLTIGFKDFGNVEFIKKTLSDGWAYFESSFKDAWGSTPRTRYNLWRFVAEMKKDDWVLVPSWGTFSVFRIEGDAEPITSFREQNLKTWSGEPVRSCANGLFIKDTHIDLGFLRRVSAIAEGISRYDYADSELTSRMKIRTTNGDISDLEDSVKRAVKAYEEKGPINLHAQIMGVSKEATKNLIVKQLNPDKFELLLKWYFQKIGASEVSIPAKNERDKRGDADIEAVFEPIKTIIYVQAKHHQGETSDWAAQQIAEYTNHKNRMDDGYSRIAWVVSTSDGFSKECIDLAREHNVALFSGLDIAQMILEAGIENLDKSL